MNATQRRSLLEIRPNTAVRLDYVVRLTGSVRPEGQDLAATVGLSYVPDKVVLDVAAFGRYLEALMRGGWTSLESLAVAVLDDVNNEAVPRWVQVVVSGSDAVRPGVEKHSVVVEDRQPRWDNAALLSRLGRA